MKNFFFCCFLIFLLVVYIYSIVFDAIPISTKVILEIVGFFTCFKYFNGQGYRLKKEYITIGLFVIAMVIWDIFTSTINGGSEFRLIKTAVPILGSFFGAQLIYEVSKKHLKSIDQFLFLVVITIFLESVLSILMKLYPALYSFVDSFLQFDFGNDYWTDIFDIERLIGIGNAIYFGVLTSCALGVITAIYLIDRVQKNIEKYLLVLMWVVISITSFLTTRWSLAIIALSVGCFLLNQRGRGFAKNIFLVGGLILAVWIALSITMSNIDDDMRRWAFSFFIDRESDDKSAENVMNWWMTTRFSIKTFLIGDARYTDPVYGYYMHVDVGFFRQIFYGGIIGLGLNLWAHVKTLKMLKKYNNTPIFRTFLFFLMLGYLVILVKGDANMMTFFVLYLVFYTGGIFERANNNLRQL